MRLIRLLGVLAITVGASTSALAGTYSTFSGYTPGAPDNPIHRSEISLFESRVTSYNPAPGVGPNFGDYETGFAPLGDLYSPVTRPSGPNTPFDKRYHPEPGTKPSPFHNGTVNNTPFNGDIDDPNDSYGFIGIDQPGSITLGFDPSIVIFDGDGHDFAVFENGFQFGGPTSLFMELAYVEVSSNGVDFARFDSISLNTAPTAGAGTFQGYDVTNVYNLAGKHATDWGTPFDLAELASHQLVAAGLLNLSGVRYIRLVDVVGSGELFDSDGNVIPGIARDSLGNAILDNWATFDSGGFDYLGLNVGAIGVLNAAVVPEPSSWALCLSGLGFLGVLQFRRRRRRGPNGGEDRP